MPSYRLKYATFGHLSISLSNLSSILRNNLIIWPIWIALSSLTLFILLWLPNLSLLTNVLFSDISFSSKMNFIATTPEILNTSHEPIEAILLVIISVLQGLSLSLLIVMWLTKRKQDSKSYLANGVATTAVIFGAGCGACGTSLIYPVLSGLGFTIAAGSSLLGVFLMTAGIVVLLYSIHRVVLMIQPEPN